MPKVVLSSNSPITLFFVAFIHPTLPLQDFLIFKLFVNEIQPFFIGIFLVVPILIEWATAPNSFVLGLI